MADIYSNIAIDLGGKFTGFVSYTALGMPERQDIKAAIIEMPEQGSGMNYTVKDRTATRHHLRAEDRFKKARKFIFSVIEAKINRVLSDGEKEAISSLMRRRGYTRLESELDLDILKDCSIEIFSLVDTNGTLFNSSEPLYEQFTEKCCDVQSAQRYKQFFNGQDLDQAIEAVSDKEEKKIYRSALKEMKSAVDNIISQEEFGHKPRKVYLENIRKDLSHDSRLIEITKLFGSADNLYRCIGNISNLQLRALRWYFNDKKMKGNATWDNQRFKDTWIRAIQFFHYPDSEAGQQAKSLIKKIRETSDCIDCLSTIEPELTIPPYEDQNNRRPPVDQTLLLSPKTLDSLYGDRWEKWTEGFINLLPELSDGLNDIANLPDRKSRLGKNCVSYSQAKIKHSYALQRLLDLSFNEDVEITKIRAWVVSPLSSKCMRLDGMIRAVVGAGDYEAFQQFVSSYYDEVRMAKEGLWSAVQTPLMEISNIHPPMKKGILKELVAGVLNIHGTFNYEEFKQVWNAKVKGNRTVRSTCKYIEDKRKSLGNAFNYEYSKAIWMVTENGIKKVNAEQKELFAIKNQVEIVSKFIGEKLNLKDTDIGKFANPFSLAQLYTLIETDIHGFSSNCQAVAAENNIRMSSLLGTGAFCSRLPAEAVRPFDGSLAKILKRQAYEIGKRKASELKALAGIKNSSIHLGILIEENQFEYSASIATIKKSKFKKKIETLSAKRLKDQEQRYQDKTQRIKEASRGVCPYTGEELTASVKCEIDHIIPRSLTKEKMGTIFNTEANLIYTSQKGNQIKGNREYTLANLHKNYLLKVFGTCDLSLIRQTIENTVEGLKEHNERLLFDLMSEQERDCCRHALFMPDTIAYKIVTEALAKQYSTRVNGTQSWFVREIISVVKQELGAWLKDQGNTIDFFASKIDVMNMAKPFREALGLLNPVLAKKDKQPITSHAIDALCVLAGAATDQRISGKITSENSLIPITIPENLVELVPDDYEIIRIQRKPFADKDAPQSRKLYKDTIYAEHFVPVMVMGSVIKLGFDWGTNNVCVNNGQDKFLKILSPLFTEQFQSNEKFHSYRIDKQKAFSLLHKVHSDINIKDKFLLEQCALLKALYYSTSSVDIHSIYDGSSKKFKTEKELLKDDKFQIKLDKLPKGIELSKKTLTLPSKQEWENIAKELPDLLGYSVSELPEEIAKDPYKAIDSRIKHELNLKARKLNHKAVKRIYSIPMLDAPSGGIRINRLDMRGHDIYQMVAANTPTTVLSKGFAIKNGSIDWKNSVNVEAYAGTKLTLKKEPIHITNEFVSMDEQRVLYRDQDTLICMSPGTQDRRYIYIEQTFDDFNRCMSNKFSSIFDITISDKSNILNQKELTVFVKELRCPLAGFPRNGKINITWLGRKVKYNYESESNETKMHTAKKSEMNDAYDKADLRV